VSSVEMHSSNGFPQSFVIAPTRQEYGPRGRGLGTRFSFRWNNQIAWITL
jgi:hypothetical protein